MTSTQLSDGSIATTPPSSISNPPASSGKLLAHISKVWFVIAAIGMMAFALFIFIFYGSRTLLGDFAGWNDKMLITGHIDGDFWGNLMFAVHVLFGAVITVSGLIQLIPKVRSHYPKLHRISGRVFIVLALILAVDGLWLTWVRGTYLSVISAVAISGNALLIIGCSIMTIRLAMQRRFAEHRRWALRAFLQVNAVWFFRVGLMGWVMLNQSPRWMNNTLSGPADIAIGFGCYLLPLAALEAYFWAQKQTNKLYQRLVAGVLILLTLFMLVGIGGAVMVMWWPPLAG